MADRKKHTETDYRSDGVHLSFYGDGEAGTQSIVGTVHRDIAGTPSIAGKYGAYLMQRGYADLLYQRTSKQYGHDAIEAEQKLWAAMTSGTWTPEASRPGVPSEPSDLAHAIAELTGMVPSHVQKDLDERLQVRDDGEPVLNAAGRRMRFWTERTQARFLTDNPDVAALVAKRQRERADRLARDAKAGSKNPQPATGMTLGSLFGGPRLPQAAE